MLTIHKTLQVNAKSDYGYHWILITKNNEFVEHREYDGYSNTEMHEICMDLADIFPKSQGYVVDWQ